jgi:hypothetical protein
MMPLTSRDTFDILSQDGKLGVLYDSLSSLHNKMNDFCKITTQASRITSAKIEVLDKKFERRKKFNSTLAGSMGFVGGIIAHLAERIIKF